MRKTYMLSELADYANDRINIQSVQLDDYITTDNLLPNKQGRCEAVNLPPQQGNMPSYSKDDILVGNIRPYLKKIWIADQSGGCSADVLVIRTKKEHDPKFVYYGLFRDDFFAHMMRGSKGTKMPRGDKNQIMNFVLPRLQKHEQKRISSLLSSLDRKIAINNKINAQLEAMAKMLYDYWFVQFDFPDENGKPYKSSGGKMVYNEILKREIPEGWECFELSDVIERIGTGLNPRQHFSLGQGSNYYVTIKSIDEGKILLDDKCDKIDDDALKIINRRSDLRVGDILFTSIQPVGITYLIQEKPKNWNINESVFSIRPNHEVISSEYAYLLLGSKDMKAFTKNASAGSIHKGIRIGVLKTFKFAFGGEKIVRKFSEIVAPQLAYMHKTEKENQELTQLRDWLLPMLMNGQVKVGSE